VQDRRGDAADEDPGAAALLVRPDREQVGPLAACGRLEPFGRAARDDGRLGLLEAAHELGGGLPGRLRVGPYLVEHPARLHAGVDGDALLDHGDGDQPAASGEEAAGLTESVETGLGAVDAADDSLRPHGGILSGGFRSAEEERHVSSLPR
jgi:hypothetical protein